jgi:hypothetical protein
LVLVAAFCAAEARAAADPPRRSSARTDRREHDREDADADGADEADDAEESGPSRRGTGRRDWSGDGASASRKASLPVTGPVRLRVSQRSGRVVVRASERKQIDAAVLDSSGGVRLSSSGDRVDVVYPGPGRAGDGRLKLEVPRGTALEIETLSADVEVEGSGAEVRIHTLSGDVRVSGSAAATLETVSGDIEVESAKGPLRVHTVSGDVELTQDGPGKLEFESTSGDLLWTGACGRDCSLDVQTLSGNVRLALAPQSGFELSFSTRSGEVHDDLGLDAGRRPARSRRRGLEAKTGSGEGRIECDTYSGDLSLVRATPSK